MKTFYPGFLIFSLAIKLASCGTDTSQEEKKTTSDTLPAAKTEIVIEAESFTGSSRDYAVNEDVVSFVLMDSAGWLAFDVDFKVAGRYRSQVVASAEAPEALLWIEDYYDNPDGRTYNVTGNLSVTSQENFETFYVDGSPFDNNRHKMKLHLQSGEARVDKIIFTLMREHQQTPFIMQQNTAGEEWALVWSDEFEGVALDTSKWTYDIGNWGWGNFELEYYTADRQENARLEDGNLIIEARKNDMGFPWTSARLTTRGKVSFLYGKIELRAIVPREKGNWAAGWTLGDDYVDEKDWPYCGEIDILESVGYEVDNESGDGIAHATVHTPAYYFKINNQISSTREVKDIADEFHTYAVEWYKDRILGFVDGEQYYLYDKNADEKEWPFDKPQNIILNLAMGGGWGGAQGMDTTVTSQKFILDYVRVYELK